MNRQKLKEANELIKKIDKYAGVGDFMDTKIETIYPMRRDSKN